MTDWNAGKCIVDACRTGRWREAVVLGEPVCASGGVGVDSATVSSLIGALIETGRLECAAKLFLQALTHGQSLAPPWQLSAGLRQQGAHEMDLECWSRWSSAFPDQPQGCMERARSAANCGRLEDALIQLESALDAFDKVAAMYAFVGHLWLDAGNRERALAAFLRAVSLDSRQPASTGRAISALERGIVELRGVSLLVPSSVVSPGVLRYLVDGGYEARELFVLQNAVIESDRILELGTGLGFLACQVARRHPQLPMVTIEANPALIPVIHDNFEANSCHAQLIHGAAGLVAGSVVFHVAGDFWASSLCDVSNASKTVMVPTIDLPALLKIFRPTVLLIDIEGGELDLLPGLDLSGVDRVIIELHPDVYGHSGGSAVVRCLLDAGFELDAQRSGGQVFLFARGVG